MPIYGYACEACGHTLDALQKMSDAPLTECPDCGEPALRRQLSAPRFRLKGQGWYETDFKSDKQRNLAGDTDGGKADSTADAKADSSADKKTDKKTDGKAEKKADDGKDKAGTDKTGGDKPASAGKTKGKGKGKATKGSAGDKPGAA